MDRLTECVGLLGELVAFPTVSSESNLDLIAFAADRLGGLGARIRLVADASGTKANLFASFGPEGDGGIVLSGHTDVVPVADQAWSSDPFVLTERGGRLHGRGTCDMKGFIAAVLAVAPDFAGPLRRPVHVALTHDEEVGCLGAQALAADLRQAGIRPRVAILGEPTSMRVIEGHKGCCEYTTEFTGLEGHGSTPARGVNAAEFAVRYAAALMTIREALPARAPAGSRFDPPHSTLQIGRIAGGVAHNVIPGLATLDWELRPVQAADRGFVLERIDAEAETLAAAMRRVHPGAGITRRVVGEVAGLEPVDANEAAEICAALLGDNGREVVSFGTEAGLFQELGMDCVVCGPGSITEAHKPDEFVERSELARCLAMLEGLAASLRP